MRALVAGDAGLIGSPVVGALRAREDESVVREVRGVCGVRDAADAEAGGQPVPVGAFAAHDTGEAPTAGFAESLREFAPAGAPDA
ncbi:hypothetical protein GCM10010269_37680 [Streptomyces humidus]|uniref:Uncharacterized protein n=1 Tax=Streptomyces humidus TaxID=52259 RepID=A0A918FXY3_9ACTN|nr:NAD(P)-dependent oxidoreductase [Streptomyces humidus]GGR95178.1 hypothetical protein GCM10010269_37680 [Streptomyces humidus]